MKSWARCILCYCLILLMGVVPVLSSGCASPRKVPSDPLPLDGSADLEVGDYVEVETLEGEHFYGEIVYLSGRGFSVNSKDHWEYLQGSPPAGITGKRKYRFEDLSLIRVAQLGWKWSNERTVFMITLGIVSVAAFVTLGLFVWALGSIPDD